MDILIIEDDNEVAEYIEEVILNTQGLESATIGRATSGEQGMQLLETMTPDLVILDVNLPGANGIMLLEPFRAKHPDIPVIIVSGFLDAAKLAMLRTLNVHTALFKPITPEGIHKAITSALNMGAPS